MAEHDVKLENFGSMFSLKGKIAVVTGGSRGLGLNAASGLMQAGEQPASHISANDCTYTAPLPRLFQNLHH